MNFIFLRHNPFNRWASALYSGETATNGRRRTRADGVVAWEIDGWIMGATHFTVLGIPARTCALVPLHSDGLTLIH